MLTSNIAIATIAIEIFGAITCCIGMAILYMLTKLKLKSQKLLLGVLFLVVFELVQDVVWLIVDGNTGSMSVWLNKVTNGTLYILNPLLLLLAGGYIFRIIREEKQKIHVRYYRRIAFLCFLSWMCVGANFFTGWMYRITDANVYSRGFGWYVYTTIFVIAVANFAIITIKNRQYMTRYTFISIMVFCVAPFAGVFIQVMAWGISAINIGLFIGVMMILFSYLHSWAKDEKKEQYNEYLLFVNLIIIMLMCIAVPLMSALLTVWQETEEHLRCDKETANVVVSEILADPLVQGEEGQGIRDSLLKLQKHYDTDYQMNLFKTVLPSGIFLLAGLAFMLIIFVIMKIHSVETIAELERKEKMAKTDKMTGLKNRYAYEIEKMETHKWSWYENLAVFVVDINGLKEINDKLGHSAGDELIVGAGKCLADVLGEYGDIYRTGGDEFVAYVHCSLSEMERLKNILIMQAKKWRGESVKNLNIAIGTARFDEGYTQSVSELSKIADYRMYEDKAFFYLTTENDRRQQRQQEPEI